MRLALALALALFACGGSHAPSPAEVCDQIVAKIRATKPPEMAAIVDKLVPAIRASCVEDSWPAEATACFAAAAPTSTALAACDRMLPKAVQDSITRRQQPAR